MSKFRYSIEASYINNDKADSEVEFENQYIQSLYIDYDYDNYNTPMLYLVANIDSKTIDYLALNSKSTLIALTIYKIDTSITPAIKELYFRSFFTYFMIENANALHELDEQAEDSNINKYRKRVTLGLISNDVLNRRNVLINTVIKGNVNSIIANFTKDYPLLLENTTNKEVELVLHPMNTLTQLFNYLDSLGLLYDTPYRVFYDIDKMYLVSSSGNSIPAKGETINSVIINVLEPTNVVGLDSGMDINPDEKIYEINIDATSVTVTNSSITDKLYTKILGISSDGSTKTVDLNVNQGSISSSKIAIERIKNDNFNQLSASKVKAELNETLVNLSKSELDSSIFTINREFHIKHEGQYKDISGKFLLSRKCEIYIPDGAEGQFISELMLSFRKIVE